MNAQVPQLQDNTHLPMDTPLPPPGILINGNLLGSETSDIMRTFSKPF